MHIAGFIVHHSSVHVLSKKINLFPHKPLSKWNNLLSSAFQPSYFSTHLQPHGSILVCNTQFLVSNQFLTNTFWIYEYILLNIWNNVQSGLICKWVTLQRYNRLWTTCLGDKWANFNVARINWQKHHSYKIKECQIH